jgi:hypothetical protein
MHSGGLKIMKKKKPDKKSNFGQQSFEKIVDFAVSEILQEVLGGKASLRSACHFIVDVSARWGKEQ